MCNELKMLQGVTLWAVMFYSENAAQRVQEAEASCFWNWLIDLSNENQPTRWLWRSVNSRTESQKDVDKVSELVTRWNCESTGGKYADGVGYFTEHYVIINQDS